MKNKKLLSCFLIFAVLLSLVSCVSGESIDTPAPENTDSTNDQTGEESEQVEERTIEGSSDVKLRLAWLGDGQNKDALDTCLQKYTEKTGIGIEAIFIPGSWADYFTKMQTMTVGGDNLDVAFVAIEGFEMFVDTGLAAPIDDWISKNKDTYDAIANDVDPNIIKMMNFDGKQYGIPMEWNNIVVHMNTDMFKEAGVDIPDENWTKDDFLEICEKLSKEREDGTKQYALSVPNYYFGVSAWLNSNGGSFMNEDYTEGNLTAPETVEVFKFLHELVSKGYAPVPENNVDYIQQLVDGNIAMGFWGRWPTTKYTDSNFSSVAIQYVPQFKEKATVWGGASIFTMSTTEHPDEATDLAMYISSPPFIEEFMQSGAIPVLNSVAEKVVPSLGYPDNAELFFESASVAKAVEAPIQYPEVLSVIERVMSEICVTDPNIDVEGILEVANEDINSILYANAK